MPTIGELLNSKYNKASKLATLSANNTTASVILFRVTGTVEITQLYGIVTTVLSSNVTAAHLRINDQTATVDITASAGTALSSLPVGSKVTRHSVNTVAIKADSSAAAKVIDPVAATAPAVHMPFEVVQKTAAVQTDIEFRYTTTNTPATGAITFYVEWQPISEGSTLVAV